MHQSKEQVDHLIEKHYEQMVGIIQKWVYLDRGNAQDLLHNLYIKYLDHTGYNGTFQEYIFGRAYPLGKANPEAAYEEIQRMRLPDAE